MLEFSNVDLVHGFIHTRKARCRFRIKNYQDRSIRLSAEAKNRDRSDARREETLWSFWLEIAGRSALTTSFTVRTGLVGVTWAPRWTRCF